MGKHMTADPTKLAQYAGAVLDASKDLKIGQEALAAAAPPPASAFGNLAWDPDWSGPLASTAEGGRAAAAAISASLTREVDGLYQTAFGYQDAEKKHRSRFEVIRDALNPFG